MPAASRLLEPTSTLGPGSVLQRVCDQALHTSKLVIDAHLRALQSETSGPDFAYQLAGTSLRPTLATTGQAAGSGHLQLQPCPLAG